MANARIHRVLLVEDDPLDASQLEQTLARAKGSARFEVARAASLKEALAYLDRCQPDLIALDLSLPDVSGEETFRQVAEHARGIAIVVLTGNDDDDVAIRLLQHGAQDYLTKSSLTPREVVHCFDFAIQRANLERTLGEARSHAEQTARAKEAFLATASHEIRTPLNAILGMAELLRATQLDADQSKYVEVFSRATHGLRDLLGNVLDLARLGAGNVELRDEPFDLAALLGDTAEMFAFQAHRKGLSMLVDSEPGCEGLWRGDAARLRQVLANLLGNATKFTERGGIRLRASCREERGVASLLIEVADSGPGVAPDRLERIFERFTQGTSDAYARHGGSGIGLALCRELLGRMGGSICVRNQETGGAVFTVDIPLAREDAAARAPVEARLRGLRLLLVEDDPFERATYAGWLRRAGAEVLEAGTADEARRYLGQLRFGAIVVDSRMPGEGGLALLDSVRSLPEFPERRVLLLMMNHRAGDSVRSQAIGAVTVCKPLRPDVLIDALAGTARPAEVGEPEQLPALRILAAEDSKDNQLLLRSHLRGTAAELCLVENGLEAAEVFERESFDLVLMDLAMPELDGHQATRRIRAWEQRNGRARTPIVALSAHAFEEAVRASREAGCDGHVSKPFDRAGLFSMIRHYAGRAEPSAPAEHALDPEIADLIPEYMARRRSDLGALRAALAQEDFATARTLGHRMKGSGGGYGMPRISEIGAGLEQAAQRADRAAAEEWVEQLAQYLATPEAARRFRPAARAAGTTPALAG